MSNPFSLQGKKALVAGASRGIGLAIAKGLARAGAHTVLASRNLDALKREAEALRSEGLQADAVQLDISSSESIREAGAAVQDVDILMNVAGINLRKHFEAYTSEEYHRILQTNLHGVFELTQVVGAGMVKRGKGGKIVFIGSIQSLRGLPYLTVYGITKSALAGLTRTLAAEWGRHNIQVNCIAPGFILTDMNRAMWQAPVMAEWVRGAQPNSKLGTPEDCAPLAVFLSSPGSDYITGQVIAIDGGYTNCAVWPFEPAE